MNTRIRVLPKHISYRATRPHAPYWARVQVRPGCAPDSACFATLEAAIQWVNDKIIERDHEYTNSARVPQGAPKGGACLLKVKDSLPAWFGDHKCRLTSNAKQAYQEAIDGALLPYFGEMIAADVGVGHVLDFVAEQRRSLTYRCLPPSDKTIRNRLTPLSVFFQDEIARGRRSENPVAIAYVRLFVRTRNPERQLTDAVVRRKFYTQEEVLRLLHTAKAYGESKKGVPSRWAIGESWYPIFFTLNTGVRLGELAALTYADIETSDALGRKLVEPRVKIDKTMLRQQGQDGRHLIQPHTKGKETRWVPVNSQLEEALRQWRSLANSRGYPTGPTDPLFPIAARYSAFKSLFRRIAGAAGLPGHKQGFHCERHACATFLISTGVPVAKVSQILGHKNLSATQRYLHLLGMDVTGTTAALGPLFEPQGTRECETFVGRPTRAHGSASASDTPFSTGLGNVIHGTFGQAAKGKTKAR